MVNRKPQKSEENKPDNNNGKALYCFIQINAGINRTINMTPSVRAKGISEITIADKKNRLLTNK